MFICLCVICSAFFGEPLVDGQPLHLEQFLTELPEDMRGECLRHLDDRSVLQLAQMNRYFKNIALKYREEKVRVACGRASARPACFDLIIEARLGMLSDDLTALLASQAPGATVKLGSGTFPPFYVQQSISIFGTLDDNGRRMTRIERQDVPCAAIAVGSIRGIADHVENCECRLIGLEVQSLRECLMFIDACGYQRTMNHHNSVFVDNCFFKSEAGDSVFLHGGTAQLHNCVVYAPERECGVWISGSRVLLRACTIFGGRTGVQVSRNSRVEVRNCTIIDNQVGVNVRGGGGVYIKDGTMLNNQNVIFSEGSSGGVACRMGRNRVSFDCVNGVKSCVRYKGFPFMFYDVKVFLGVRFPALARRLGIAEQ